MTHTSEGRCSLSRCSPAFRHQELSGGHALWYTGTLTMYHYNFVGVFNVNPAVSYGLKNDKVKIFRYTSNFF